VKPLDFARGNVMECHREADVLEGLSADATLESWSADLRSHARTCSICSDIVAVALPLLQEHHASVEDAHPPSSGIVWWRAQMRARHEAARVATRPITVVQGVAVVSATALFMMLLSAAGPTVFGWFGGVTLFSGFGEMFRLPEIELPALMPSTNMGLLLAAACAVCLLAGPLAVYFALGDD
jgi:hypothetical protein